MYQVIFRILNVKQFSRIFVTGFHIQRLRTLSLSLYFYLFVKPICVKQPVKDRMQLKQPSMLFVSLFFVAIVSISSFCSFLPIQNIIDIFYFYSVTSKSVDLAYL